MSTAQNAVTAEAGNSSATIHARVGDSAIDKVTRLFSAGLADIFTETLQNSRRGGANHVAATIEQDGDTTRVTLADDGAGIADPAILLTFGESAWKDGIAEAEDPAGFGLLALSRRGCTLRWRVPSQDPSPGYRLVLEPAHFLGRDAAHVVPDDSAPWPHGTAVTFEASEAPHSVRAFLETAARHYPLPVSVGPWWGVNLQHTRWTMKTLERYIGGLVIGQGRHAGQPFKLLAWQRRLLSGAFGQPGDAAISMGRGGGKSTFTAAIACAAVDVGGPLVEPMAECLVVASSFDQGLINFRHMLHFMQPSFEKYGTGPGGRFRIQDSANRATITDRETGAMVRVLGSDPRRLHGAAPKLLLYDEVAQWPPERVEPMLGTRPAMPDHPFQRALEGHGVGFSLCYAAKPNDPPFQKRTWLKSNPGLDHLPDLEAVIRAEAEDAKRDESAMQSFRALRLNQGVSDTTVSVLVDADTWRGAEALPEQDGRANEYVLGLDLGQNAAMSAGAAYFRDGTLEAVACFPELPSLAARGLSDGVGGLYQQMADRGELFTAGRRVSDIPELLREYLERWGRPVAITCDRWRLAELKQHLDAVSFPLAELIERGQGFKDGGQDVRDFRAAVLGDHVRPSQSLLLRAAMSEARVTGDPSGNWKLAKHVQGGRRANARDDACAAAIIAVATGYRRWTAKPSRPRWRYRGMAA